jgi:hypothetical protein
MLTEEGRERAVLALAAAVSEAAREQGKVARVLESLLAAVERVELGLVALEERVRADRLVRRSLTLPESHR